MTTDDTTHHSCTYPEGISPQDKPLAPQELSDSPPVLGTTSEQSYIRDTVAQPPAQEIDSSEKSAPDQHKIFRYKKLIGSIAVYAILISIVISTIGICIVSKIEIQQRKKFLTCLDRQIEKIYQSPATASLGKTSLVLDYLQGSIPAIYFTLHNYHHNKGLTIEGISEDSNVSTGKSRLILLNAKWGFNNLIPPIKKTVHDFLIKNEMETLRPQVLISSVPALNAFKILINTDEVSHFLTLYVRPIIVHNDINIELIRVRYLTIGLPPFAFSDLLTNFNNGSKKSIIPEMPKDFTLESVNVKKDHLDVRLKGENFTLQVPDPHNPKHKIPLVNICGYKR